MMIGCCHLSIPRVINMKKNKIAQKKLPGMEAIASEYTMNTRPSPSIPTSSTLSPCILAM